jgi:hypothetical protein
MRNFELEVLRGIYAGRLWRARLGRDDFLCKDSWL